MTETAQPTTDKISVDEAEIPDRWRLVELTPSGWDGQGVMLAYDREDCDDPVCTITVTDADTSQRVDYPDDCAVVVEVLDENGEESPQSTRLPQPVLETFDDVDVALQRMHELARKFPLTETRTPDDQERVELRSPFRPLPRSARKELADTVEILDDLDGDESGRNDGVVVGSRPPEAIIKRYELRVVREPEIVYLNDDGAGDPTRVEIYTDPDKVVEGGRELETMTAVETIKQAEKQEPFTRIDGCPEFVDGIEVADIATDAELPIDHDEIPDRWEVEHNSRRGDQRMFILICRPPESDTDIRSTITFSTPTRSCFDHDKFTVAVTDQDAEGPSRKRSQPFAERVRYDDMEQAIDFVRGRVKEYPINHDT
jgi:hypothetical protein